MARAKKTEDKELIHLVTKRILSDLLPYQLKWIQDKSDFRHWTKSRQIGASTVVCLEALIDAVYNRTNTILITVTDEQAKELIRKVNKWVKVYAEVGVDLGKGKKTEHHIILNGQSIQAFGSSVPSIQGYTGNVIIDEFSLFAKDQEVYEAIYPTVSADGLRLSIIGRPHGVNNLFWKIKEGLTDYRDYSRHFTDINTAVRDGLRRNINKLRSGIDEEGYDEQYLCIPRDSATAYFPYELLRTCIGNIPSGLTGDTYITVDVGAGQDKTSIVVWIKKDEKWYVVDVKEIRTRDYSEQELKFGDYIEKYKPIKFLIDKGLNGMLVQNLEKKWGKVIHGVSMNTSMQMTGFPAVKKLFEDKNIIIPNSDLIVDQLHSVKRDMLTGGKIKYSAPRNSKGHADTAFSMCLIGEVIGEKKKQRKVFVGYQR